MSLIEEALRKQREETDRTQPAIPVPQGPGRQAPNPAGGPPPPPGSTPSAPPAIGDAPAKSRKTWLLLIGVGVLMVVAVAVLSWMFIFGLWLFKAPGSAPGTGAVAVNGHSPTGAATRAVAPAPATAVTSVVAVVVAPVAATSRPPDTATGTVAVIAPVTPAMVATAAPPVAVVTAPRVKPPAPTTTVETGKLPVVWPRLTVSGFMGGGRTVRSTVIINGQMLTQGETIEGAKIVAVEKRGVTLSFSGETRTLAVGTSTE